MTNSADQNPDRELARKLELAIRAADLGIWEWDLRTDQFIYSDRAKEIFGFPKDRPVTREQIVAVLHPGDHRIAREQAERGLDPSLEKRDPYRYRIYRADNGALRWIHAFGEPIFERSEGQLVAVRYVGTLQDVTDEALAKERLIQQEARLRLAIEASGIAVWEVNLADQSVAHSPELNRLCGFPADARPTLEDLRSRYAPGERERLEKEGAEARSRGDTKLASEIRQVWPDGTEKWLALRAQLAPGETSYDGRIIGTLADITDQKRREERQALLVSEFKHRIKNSFAITQSILNQTLRGTDIPEEVRSKLFARLQAMANAHELIARGAWETASLASIVEKVIHSFHAETNPQIEVDVDDVGLSPSAALSFSLVLHELMTNAVKYGAFSNGAGRVRLVAKRDEDERRLRMRWEEAGGPPPRSSANVGFGTRLIDRVVVAEFGAAVERDFTKEGLHLQMVFPLDSISQQVQTEA